MSSLHRQGPPPKPANVCGPLVTAAFAALLVSACSAQPSHGPLLTPAPGSPIRIEGAPGSIAVGQVDGDANPDLVVAGRRGVTVLLGQGGGRFRAAPGSPIQAPERITEMLLHDFNGDGKLDLALASHDSYGVTLLFGDGKGGYALAPHSPVIMKEGRHPHTHGLLAGDLNGDGKPDLVTVNSDDNDVSVAFGDGTGSFTRGASPFAVGPSPYPGALGDLNLDGHLDIIATSTGRRNARQEASTRGLRVLFGDGRGDFRPAPGSPFATGKGAWQLAVGDVNGDRKPDVVTTNLESDDVTVLLAQ